MLFRLTPESMVFLRVGNTLSNASVIRATNTSFFPRMEAPAAAYSDGFAGSMTTASLVLSSVTM